MARLGGIAAALVALAAAGCGASLPSAGDLAVARMDRLAKAHADSEKFVLRLNPPSCDCPPAEVRLDGAWHRVFLEPRDEDGPATAAKAVLAEAAARGDVTATVQVAGKLGRSSRLASNRAPCLVLKVLRVCRDEACAPPP